MPSKTQIVILIVAAFIVLIALGWQACLMWHGEVKQTMKARKVKIIENGRRLRR